MGYVTHILPKACDFVQLWAHEQCHFLLIGHLHGQKSPYRQFYHPRSQTHRDSFIDIAICCAVPVSENSKIKSAFVFHLVDLVLFSLFCRINSRNIEKEVNVAKVESDIDSDTLVSETMQCNGFAF